MVLLAKRWRGRMEDVFLPLGFCILLVILWEGVVRLLGIREFLLPPPSTIARYMITSIHVLPPHLWATVYEIILGFILGFVVGLLLGIGIVYVKFMEKAVYPVIVAFQVIPKIAIAPLLLVWMGYGMWPKVTVAFLITFFPIVVSTVNGLRSVEPELMDLMNSLKANTRQKFIKVQFPNALPYLFNGMEIAITLAVIGAIIGEFVGSDRGLGYLLMQGSYQFKTDMVFTSLIFLAVLGVLFYEFVVLMERVFIPWHIRREPTTAIRGM